jgi:hypothetical protein
MLFGIGQEALAPSLAQSAAQAAVSPAAPLAALSVEQTTKPEKPFRVGTSLGYSFSGYREDTDLPLNRYLNTLTFIIDGNIEKGKYFHSFNVGFFRGKNEALPANPVYQTEVYPHDQIYVYYQKETVFTRGYLEYALDYRLWGNKTFPGYLGGAFRADVYAAETALHLYFTGIVSLDVHASQKWIINEENVLVFSAGFPVFGYAIRPAYFGWLYGDVEKGAAAILGDFGKITSVHNYWAVFGDLKYHHKVNSLISLYSGLGFELSRINFPRPRKDAILRLSSGMAFTF